MTPRPVRCWKRASTHQRAGLRISVTSDDSRMINTDRTPKVILSASGMCEAGRIRHHLKHNLWRPECTILFVGFQAVGTLGRTLIEGVDSVKLFGEPIEVKAEICQLTGMSGHADKDGLLRWVNAFTEKPRRVFVIHGEDEVENRFVDTLTEQALPPVHLQWCAVGHRCRGCSLPAGGTKVRVEQRTGEGANRAATVFQRLLSAGKRLLRVIEHNEGGANKDLPNLLIRSTLCATNGTGNVAAFCGRAAREKRSCVKSFRAHCTAEKRGEIFVKNR